MKALYTALFLFSLILPSSADDHQKDKSQHQSSHQSVRSPGGFIAHYFRFITDEEEAEGRILIEKEGHIIATIKGARPVSFSPTSDILLVREDVADDDLRHYFLNIGAGQFSRKAERAQYTFGNRFSSKAVWSDDGKSLVLFDHPGITDAAPTVIKVAEKLGK
ncbi:hypothetical protein N9A94_01535 [Akkermansiaceae bacterium]|nr:hypothetical protein [Akkermansiaceae bacterium]